ncbi:hypothetical protein OGAPHI_002658 [Ogataea philodendri]|uniref:Uncharacterized protein n=1 Tax=Ogataea philodendri TaxID=1378263 RepID=A0A9P8PAW9_9ASCO|nr:uncharacterized protein OGAPHI_002658 [Ogataea philodendri]KAH3668903.1 hypothetical protein OGAPHI_002658 [Ogataea philodendri]
MLLFRLLTALSVVPFSAALTRYTNNDWVSLGNNLSAVLLLQGQLPQEVYKQVPDPVFLDDRTTINPYGLVNLTSLMVASKEAREERQVDHTDVEIVSHLLGLKFDPGLLFQLAQMGLGAAGATTAPVFDITIHEPQSTSDKCRLRFQPLLDYARMAGNAAYEKLSWETLQKVDSPVDVPTVIAGWLKNASKKNLCQGFVYAIKDDHKPADYWIVAGIPWTTGCSCYSVSTVNDLAKSLQDLWTSVFNHEADSSLIIMDDGGSWRANVILLDGCNAAQKGLTLW